MSRAFYAPVVREHPSKPQGRLDSPQRTPDLGGGLAVFPQPQNPAPMSEGEGKLVATALLCRSGVNDGFAAKMGRLRRAIPTRAFSLGAAAPPILKT
jgi:hypothetical protein